MKKMSGEDYVLYDCPEPEIFFKKMSILMERVLDELLRMVIELRQRLEILELKFEGKKLEKKERKSNKRYGSNIFKSRRDEVDREIVLKALEGVGGDIRLASERLGISEGALRVRARTLGIAVGRKRRTLEYAPRLARN
jgi:DNA-binding NtrC family response regulator